MRSYLGLSLLSVLLVIVIAAGSTEAHSATLVTAVPVGGVPSDAVFDPTNSYVYVPNSASNSIAVISGSSLIANLTGEVQAYEVDVNPANGYAYASLGNGSVTVISGTNVIGTVLLTDSSMNLVYDPVNGYMYGWNYNALDEIDGTSIVGSLSLYCDEERQPAVDVSNGYVYLPCEGRGGGDSLLVISGTNLVGNISLHYLPLYPNVGPVFDPSNGYIYMPTDSNVTVVSGTSIIAGIPADPPSATPIFDPANGYVYMTSYDTQLSTAIYGAGLLGIFSGTALIANLTVPSSLYSPVVDVSNGQILLPVSYPGDGLSIQTIDGAGLGSCLTLQSSPTGSVQSSYGAAFDAAQGYLYVPAVNGSDLFIVSPSGGLGGAPCLGSVGVASSTGAGTTLVSSSSTSASSSIGPVSSFPPIQAAEILTFLKSIPGVGLVSSLLIGGALAALRSRREQANLSLQSPTQWLRVVTAPIQGVPFLLDGQSARKTGLHFRKGFKTPYFKIMGPGRHVVELPESVEIGGTMYRFARWSDGPTNRSREFHLLGVPLAVGAVVQHAKGLPRALRTSERSLFIQSLEAVYAPTGKTAKLQGGGQPS